MTEYRSIARAVTNKSPEGIFVARLVSYNTCDDYGTCWLPGCLSAGLDRHLPIVLFGHTWSNLDNVLGRGISWRDAPAGPELTARLDVSAQVPKAAQVAAQLASGTLTDVSIGFVREKYRPPTTEEKRRLPGVIEMMERASVDELSIVIVGAVKDAKILASRHASQSQRPFGVGNLTRVELAPGVHRWESSAEKVGRSPGLSALEEEEADRLARSILRRSGGWPRGR